MRFMLLSYKEVNKHEFTQFKLDYEAKYKRELLFKENNQVYENYDGDILVAKVDRGKYYILDEKKILKTIKERNNDFRRKL